LVKRCGMMSRRVKAGQSRTEAGRKEGKFNSWRRGKSGEGGFQNEAGEGKHERERIAHQGGFGRVG
jgi:hypothetical protein